TRMVPRDEITTTHASLAGPGAQRDLRLSRDFITGVGCIPASATDRRSNMRTSPAPLNPVSIFSGEHHAHSNRRLGGANAPTRPPSVGSTMVASQDERVRQPRAGECLIGQMLRRPLLSEPVREIFGVRQSLSQP